MSRLKIKRGNEIWNAQVRRVYCSLLSEFTLLSQLRAGLKGLQSSSFFAVVAGQQQQQVAEPGQRERGPVVAVTEAIAAQQPLSGVQV